MTPTEKAISDLREHLNPAKRQIDIRGSVYLSVTPRIVCADGFSLSVQAGDGLYCSPRNNDGDWHQVEVGYPSERAEPLMPYVEDEVAPTETVYGYVPIETVAQVIADHGGVAL